jgi:hypothetical protein
MTVDPYAPVPHPVYPNRYEQGHTYVFNGYRMYFLSGYWYYVDYPDTEPIRDHANQYRTVSAPLKFFGFVSFFLGIGLMMTASTGGYIVGPVLLALGLFGVVIGLGDSMRNHPDTWKAAAVIGITALAVHQLTDDD